MNKILVIGDSCIDVYVYTHCSRLCPEAPVPVLDVLREKRTPGMAGNVFRNIQALNQFGGMNQSSDFITNSNAEDILKVRYVEDKRNYMFIRVDSLIDIPRITKDQISKIDFNYYSAVVISDYNKGFLLEEDIEYISNLNPTTFLDTKKILGAWAKNITFIKINKGEFEASKRDIVANKLEDKIVQTLGEDGCSYGGQTFSVKAVEVKDLSGAGDSFLAGLSAKFVDTKNIRESIIFANACATEVVQKKGVSCLYE